MCILEINQLTNKKLIQELFPEVAVPRQGRNSPSPWHPHVQGKLKVKWFESLLVWLHAYKSSCIHVILWSMCVHSRCPRVQRPNHISYIIFMYFGCTHHHTGSIMIHRWAAKARGEEVSFFRDFMQILLKVSGTNYDLYIYSLFQHQIISVYHITLQLVVQEIWIWNISPVQFGLSLVARCS